MSDGARRMIGRMIGMCRACFALAFILDAASGASLGFDRNEYPGDKALPGLRKTFSFAGYWLTPPPGAKSNSWLGKRPVLRDNGFGFLILFNGRLDRELRAPVQAKTLGATDGRLAATLARKEGFPARAILFLDVEEGGRLLQEQFEYVTSWIDAVSRQGFRAGVYCSGMPVQESGGTTITTADDLHDRAGRREIHYFVYGDACPPSPGCVFHLPPLNPKLSGIPFADAWQFAQSPRRPEYTSRCAATYSVTNICPAPESKLDIDVSTADGPDPSRGR